MVGISGTEHQSLWLCKTGWDEPCVHSSLKVLITATSTLLMPLRKNFSKRGDVHVGCDNAYVVASASNHHVGILLGAHAAVAILTGCSKLICMKLW